jgi:hypothetical protein
LRRHAVQLSRFDFVLATPTKCVTADPGAAVAGDSPCDSMGHIPPHLLILFNDDNGMRLLSWHQFP